MSSYEITIHNETGQPQRYVLYSQPPEVSPYPWRGRVYSSIIDTLSVPSGSHTFIVPRAYIAISGAFFEEPRPGAKFAINSFRGVELGYVTDGGTITPGTTAEAVVQGDGLVLVKGREARTGMKGSFVIETARSSGDFGNTREKRNDNQLLLGVGIENDKGGISAMSVFNPRLDERYQITPRPVLYVATDAAVKERTAVDMEAIKGSVRIDFTARKTSSVVVRHTERGYELEGEKAIAAPPVAEKPAQPARPKGNGFITFGGS